MEFLQLLQILLGPTPPERRGDGLAEVPSAMEGWVCLDGKFGIGTHFPANEEMAWCQSLYSICGMAGCG